MLCAGFAIESLAQVLILYGDPGLLSEWLQQLEWLSSASLHKSACCISLSNTKLISSYLNFVVIGPAVVLSRVKIIDTSIEW